MMFVTFKNVHKISLMHSAVYNNRLLIRCSPCCPICNNPLFPKLHDLSCTKTSDSGRVEMALFTPSDANKANTIKARPGTGIAPHPTTDTYNQQQKQYFM